MSIVSPAGEGARAWILESLNKASQIILTCLLGGGMSSFLLLPPPQDNGFPGSTHASRGESHGDGVSPGASPKTRRAVGRAQTREPSGAGPLSRLTGKPTTTSEDQRKTAPAQASGGQASRQALGEAGGRLCAVPSSALRPRGPHVLPPALPSEHAAPAGVSGSASPCSCRAFADTRDGRGAWVADPLCRPPAVCTGPAVCRLPSESCRCHRPSPWILTLRPHTRSAVHDAHGAVSTVKAVPHHE